MKNEILKRLNEEGYLISDDFMEEISDDFDVDNFIKSVKDNIAKNNEVVVLNKDMLNALKNNNLIELNWNEFDNSKALLEKGKDGELYQAFKNILHYPIDNSKKREVDDMIHSIEEPVENTIMEESDNQSNVMVLKSYAENASKKSVEDFVGCFRKRLEGLSTLLQSRQELEGVISLNRLSGKKDGDRVAIIGMVNGKRMTKNDNVMLTLEDFTGDIFVLINKNKSDLYNEAKDICEDEVIGVVGVKSGGFVFVDDLIFPDIPLSQGIKKYDEEVYCVFISDLHVGSKHFLTEGFDKFLKWINLEGGNEEQKKIASKVKYLFISGDLVEGVGLYANQEKDLDIENIYEQYNEFTRLIKKIPCHIKIVICPGNHDAIRLTEPQPAIGKEYCEELSNRDNIFFVSNPALVNVHSKEDFSGFDVLLYHGGSFNYYLDNVESIRLKGGYKRADLVMQYLMKRRHLAPTHVSTSYIPNPEEDCLIIDKIPDFFLTGHIHRLNVNTYKGISMINASCWVGISDFQEKIGLIPQPGKVVVSNLQTREMKVLSFCDEY